MEEMTEPRPTFVLLRGAYDKEGAPVTAATPSPLSAFPSGLPTNRLGLAHYDDGRPVQGRNDLLASPQVFNAMAQGKPVFLCVFARNVAASARRLLRPKLHCSKRR